MIIAEIIILTIPGSIILIFVGIISSRLFSKMIAVLSDNLPDTLLFFSGSDPFIITSVV